MLVIVAGAVWWTCARARVCGAFLSSGWYNYNFWISFLAATHQTSNFKIFSLSLSLSFSTIAFYVFLSLMMNVFLLLNFYFFLQIHIQFYFQLIVVAVAVVFFQFHNERIWHRPSFIIALMSFVCFVYANRVLGWTVSAWAIPLQQQQEKGDLFYFMFFFCIAFSDNLLRDNYYCTIKPMTTHH